MGTTNFDTLDVDVVNVGSGFMSVSQVASVGFDATLVQSATLTVPASARIVEIIVDVLTAYDSLTSATLSVGITAGGTEYASSVNAKTAGRAYPTHTAAQLSAMQDVSTNTSVVATVTSVGQPTAGSVKVTVVYAPTA